MWKRDEAVRPASGQSGMPQPAPPATAGTPGHTPNASQKLESDIVNIGKSIIIKGELNGSEDLTIEGVVEGTIQLRDNVLTIGPNGRIQAQVFAKAVIVLGQVSGNIAATEKIDIRDNGSVDGDIVSPRVAIAEGAHFRGSVDMQRKGAQAPSPQKPAAQSSQPPAAEAAAAAASASGNAAAKPPAVAAQRVGA